MNSKIATHARAVLGAAAAACALFTGTVAAKDVTVAIHVSTQGLDLSQPADAQTFYRRLEQAARVACTHGNRADLAPAGNPAACYEQALAGAIRTARSSMLTQVYLATHTLQEAAARGIEVPAQVAVK